MSEYPLLRNILFSFGEKNSFDLFHLGVFPCFVVLFLEMTTDERGISKANNVRNGCNFSPINWHFETLWKISVLNRQINRVAEPIKRLEYDDCCRLLPTTYYRMKKQRHLWTTFQTVNGLEIHIRNVCNAVLCKYCVNSWHFLE